MPFEKGKSGNPGGRPSPARQELSDLLDELFTPAKRRKVLSSLITDAINGDKDARTLLLAYTYGKPVERKELTGAAGGPVDIGVRYIDYRDGLAETEAGSGSDSPTPGEN